MSPRVRLVLVHGTQLSAAQWHGYAELLGSVADVVTPDLPGHGKRVGEAFTWDAALATLDDAVRGAAAADGPVVLAGHSLGGYVAAAWAHDHPTALAGLGLLGAAAEPRGVGARIYRGIARANRAWGPERMTRLLDTEFRQAGIPPATAAAVAAAGYGFAAVTPAWASVMGRCGSHLLGPVTCPVLLLAGQFDQLRIGTRGFAAAARSSAEVRVHVIPRATHLFPMTHPQQTGAELLWLCRRARVRGE